MHQVTPLPALVGSVFRFDPLDLQKLGVYDEVQQGWVSSAGF